MYSLSLSVITRSETLTSQSADVAPVLMRWCFPPRVSQRRRGRALLPDAGVSRPGGGSSGGQQGPPLLRLAGRHLLAARHVAGDLRRQSNPRPCREGQWPSGPDEGGLDSPAPPLPFSFFPLQSLTTHCVGCLNPLGRR